MEEIHAKMRNPQDRRALYLRGNAEHQLSRYCQLELLLACLDVSLRQETTVYTAFLSERSRVLS